MVTLKDIDNKLNGLIPEDEKENARPFLCEGSPIDCEVFIIGHNPGVSIYFCDCWSPDSGCDRIKWIKKYYDKCDTSGKRRSPTREKTEMLIGEFNNRYKILDTNICHKYSSELGELPKKDRENTKVCDYLIENIGPKLIFVHGKYAIEHLEQLTPKKERLPKDKLLSVELYGKRTYIYAGYHLSRCWSYAGIKKLGQELLKWCETNLSKSNKRT